MFHLKSPVLLCPAILVVVIMTIFNSVIANNTETNIKFNSSSLYLPIKLIYYDQTSDQHIEITINDTSRSSFKHYELLPRGIPCKCYDLICKCCNGIKIGSSNVNNICFKLNFIPEEFAIESSFIVNDRELIKFMATGKNPPPLCATVPILPPVPFISPIKLCIQLYNIHIINSTFIVCVDLHIKIVNFSVIIVHLNCITFNFLNGTTITWTNNPDNIEFSDTSIDNLTLFQSTIPITSGNYDEINGDQHTDITTIVGNVSFSINNDHMDTTTKIATF